MKVIIDVFTTIWANANNLNTSWIMLKFVGQDEHKRHIYHLLSNKSVGNSFSSEHELLELIDMTAKAFGDEINISRHQISASRYESIRLWVENTCLAWNVPSPLPEVEPETMKVISNLILSAIQKQENFSEANLRDLNLEDWVIHRALTTFDSSKTHFERSIKDYINSGSNPDEMYVSEEVLNWILATQGLRKWS